MGKTPENVLSVIQAASLLRVAEQTVSRWVRQGLVPTHRIGGELCFFRQELEDWAHHKQIGTRPGLLRPELTTEEEVDLSHAIALGGIHYDVPGDLAEDIFQNVVNHLPIGSDNPALKETLLNNLLERELLAPTGLGDGVALPHARHPRDWGEPESIVGVFFLEQPRDLHAIDGQPVFVLFVVLCRTVKGHLQMLSQISHMLKAPGMLELLHTRPTPETLMENIAHARTARRQSGIGHA